MFTPDFISFGTTIPTPVSIRANLVSIGRNFHWQIGVQTMRICFGEQ